MTHKASVYEKYVKRCLDLVVALIALLILSPLFLVLIVAGTIKMKWNPFFTQERPGKNEKIFKLIKFRTMSNEKDKEGKLLPDEKRLTKYGKFLRSTSLDELPELINIICGQLSFVGPRPLLVSYLPYYMEEEHHRHDVTPGLTGLSQVSGRNYVTWEDKFAMDLEYVNNLSFALDVSILFKTVAVVIKRENIETSSAIVHDGVLYRPLDVERAEKIKGN